MKKTILALLLAVATLSGCGNDKVIDGKHYETFGLFNQESTRDPAILYEVSPGSVIWSIILIETIVFPVYIIGWDLYQPVQKRDK